LNLHKIILKLDSMWSGDSNLSTPTIQLDPHVEIILKSFSILHNFSLQFHPCNELFLLLSQFGHSLRSQFWLDNYLH